METEFWLERGEHRHVQTAQSCEESRRRGYAGGRQTSDSRNIERSAIKETCDGHFCLITLIIRVLPGIASNFSESAHYYH